MKICAKVEIPRDILVEISQELQRISSRYKVRTEAYLNWTFKCQMNIKDYDYNRVVTIFEHFAKLVKDKNISIGGILSFGCEDIKIPEKPVPDISNIAIKLNPSNDIFLLRKRIMETLHDDDYFKNIFFKENYTHEIPHVNLIRSLETFPNWKIKAIRDEIHNSQIFSLKKNFEIKEIEILKRVEGKWLLKDIITIGP